MHGRRTDKRNRQLAALRPIIALGGLAILLVLALPWACMPARWPASRRLERTGWAILLRGLRVKVVCRGDTTIAGPGLIVANHVSWSDIAVLSLLFDTTFVAKSEVRGWPVLGWLAWRHGCRFLRRGSRRAAHELGVEMPTHRSRPLLTLFPEGTTSDGSAVLPFRSSLFQGAVDGAATVQPVSIVYRRRDGAALSASERRQVAWLDDDLLLSHFAGLARLGGIIAEVWIEDPVAAAERKALARQSHAVIARRIAVRGGA